jgi:hypothetical protein
LKIKKIIAGNAMMMDPGNPTNAWCTQNCGKCFRREKKTLQKQKIKFFMIKNDYMINSFFAKLTIEKFFLPYNINIIYIDKKEKKIFLIFKEIQM